jgi:hypothetical protein
MKQIAVSVFERNLSPEVFSKKRGMSTERCAGVINPAELSAS